MARRWDKSSSPSPSGKRLRRWTPAEPPKGGSPNSVRSARIQGPTPPISAGISTVSTRVFDSNFQGWSGLVGSSNRPERRGLIFHLHRRHSWDVGQFEDLEDL